MKLLAVVTSLSIYHVCSTGKMFWGGKFTPANMKHFGCRNVRKHREINNGEKYIILYISLKFANIDNMKITY